MVKLRPLERIFSITNSGTNKLVMLFGIPIKIDRTKFYRNLCLKSQVDNNKIVIDNFEGNSYGCNPKYIVEEIIKRKLPYELVWLVKSVSSEFEKGAFPIIKRKLPYELVWLVKSVSSEFEKGAFPEQVRLVPIYKKDAFVELATAKLWIDNQRKYYFIKRGLIKKNNQRYIQTWHGSLGIKKLDADVTAFNDEDNQNWVTGSKYESSIMDYYISNSSFESNVVTKALWFNNCIKEYGHPRNDIFFKSEKEQQEIKDKVFQTLQIDKNKKVLLYVPSFRDDKKLSCYGLDTSAVANVLKEKFGGDWVIAIRLHPRVKKYSSKLFSFNDKVVDATYYPVKKYSSKLFSFNDKVVDATYYPDIQELLLASDIAITDYSSCIFDFMLSRKPGFIFATDIEQFNTDRGFYYPLETTPFPIATNNYELIKNIENFDYEEYKQKVEDFLKDKGCMEDGHASERVVDLIEKIMSGELDE